MSAPPLNRVLVIEDEADTRENLRDILEMDGCEVEDAATLAAAMRRDDWDRFSVIILDWLLPDGSAAVLLPKLARLAPGAAVIVSTGTRELDGAILALRHGAADYILKPINADALRASVQRIVARQRLDHELQTTQRRMQALFDSTLDAILLIDDSGRLIDANPAATALFGRTRDALLQTSVGELIDPASKPDFERLWDGAAIPGRRMAELRIPRADGGLTDVESHATAHAPEGFRFLVLRDVTERRLAQERLLQAGRLAAIGEAMTGLAHESRNALQRSQACLEMLSRHVRDLPAATDLIGRIQRAQDDLHRLYEEVREYAAPIRLTPVECRLDEVLSAVWDDLSVVREGRSARLEIRSAIDAQCTADRFALRQIYRNILENSLTACSGDVEIFARFDEVGFRGQPAVRVSVRDNGPGFTREQQRIFDAFYTTRTQGTGLGMAIVRRLVETHGGEIRAGADGPGAEIVMTLPRRNV